MRTVIAYVAVCGMAVLAGVVPAAPASDGKPIALFDGKTLEGWDVLKCEAEVKDGAILLKAGNGLVQTKEQYADFILELEWKALKTEGLYDSGIYLRYTEVPGKAPWPRKYQLNLTRGKEGNIPGVKAATSKGLVKEGEWNHFKVTVKGKTAALEINGKPAWKVDVIEVPKGYIGLQAEIPRGGPFLFRNIRLTKL